MNDSIFVKLMQIMQVMQVIQVIQVIDSLQVIEKVTVSSGAIWWPNLQLFGSVPYDASAGLLNASAGLSTLAQDNAVTPVINLPASGGRKEFVYVYQNNPPSTHI